MALDVNTEVVLVQEFGAYERHFNQIQSNYRAIASTWLLAAFTGIGYLLTKDDFKLLPFPITALIGGICLVVCAGIMLIWVLDVKIYHRLLQSCFVSGMEFESNRLYLPQIRDGMDKNKEQVNQGLATFYVGTLMIMALIGVGAEYVLPAPNYSADQLNIYQFVIKVGFLVLFSLALLLLFSLRDKKAVQHQECQSAPVHPGEKECTQDELDSKQKQLIEAATEVMKHAYSPYSKVKVGAAILSETSGADEIITGTNFENASYSLTICAERAAVAKAVSEGKTKFKAIAVVASGAELDPTEYFMPCGACRAVLHEFSKECDSNLQVIIARPDRNKYLVTTINALMPRPLQRKSVQGGAAAAKPA